MKSRSVVTKVGTWSQQAYGVASGPFENPAESVNFYVPTHLENVVGNFKVPNPSSFTKTVSTLRSGEIRTRQTGNGPDWYDDFVVGNYTGNMPEFNEVVEPGIWDSLADDNWGKVYDKIRGGNNLVVDLAESGATLAMLRNSTKMRTVMSDFFGRNRVPKKLKRLQERLDYVTGKWLEYRYGWMPLVYSTYDAMETLANKVVVDPDVWVRVRSSRKLSKTTSAGSGSWSEPTVRTVYEGSFRCETKVNFHLPPGLGIHDWTSLNPLGIAWELLPLSFVADWFVNVSEQMSLWENHWLYHSAFRSGYQSLSSKREQSLSISGSTVYPVEYWPNGSPMNYQVARRSISAKESIRETYKNRTVLQTIPFPNGLRVEVKLGAKRLLDAASLLQQLVAKRLR